MIKHRLENNNAFWFLIGSGVMLATIAVAIALGPGTFGQGKNASLQIDSSFAQETQNKCDQYQGMIDSMNQIASNFPNSVYLVGPSQTPLDASDILEGLNQIYNQVCK